MALTAAEQLQLLTRNAADVIPRDQLLEKLVSRRSLRVKLGIDPSRPGLHLGHAVVLRKLREFQELGHTAVLIVGDFTGLVGDPSGQSETRPMLSSEEMDANATTYLDQAGLVLDVDRAEIHRNSEWLSLLATADVLRLTSQYTVARMLERDDFRGRYREGKPISVVEFLYPLMQAYDSVEIAADVEMGGTDQTFNLLVGRDIQRAYGQEPQVVFTMPLLEGTDGVRKMSKSFDNHIGLTDPAEDMFGKLMSIPDDLVPRYESLVAAMSPDELTRVDLDVDPAVPEPAKRKRRLAKSIVAQFHPGGWAEAHDQEQRFNRRFRDREIPVGVPSVRVPPRSIREGKVYLPRLLADLGLVSSNSEGRRQIEQGAVRIDGRPVTEPDADVEPDSLVGRVIKVGRLRVVRIASA